MSSRSVVYHMVRELKVYTDVDTVNTDVHALLKNTPSLVPNTGMHRGSKLFGLWGTVAIRFQVRVLEGL